MRRSEATKPKAKPAPERASRLRAERDEAHSEITAITAKLDKAEADLREKKGQINRLQTSVCQLRTTVRVHSETIQDMKETNEPNHFGTGIRYGQPNMYTGSKRHISEIDDNSNGNTR